MLRILFTVVFLVVCLTAYAPAADGANGLFLSGSDELPVRVEVFSDFQCPACSFHFLNTIRQILNNYEGRVGVVYYEFPLERHQYSRQASRYVSAAARVVDQQKLLALFEALFTGRDEWAKDGNLDASALRALSPEDLQKVKNIMETDREGIEREIDMSIREGEKRNIPATPTIFIYHDGKPEMITAPPNVRDMYTLLSWRLNGILRR